MSGNVQNALGSLWDTESLEAFAGAVGDGRSDWR